MTANTLNREHGLADSSAALLQCMGAAQACCVHGFNAVIGRCADAPFVYHGRHSIEQLILLNHVIGLKHRSGKHELPVQRKCFGFENSDLQVFRIINEGNLPPRFDEVGDCGNVLVCRG